jgi:hypothetical protein
MGTDNSGGSLVSLDPAYYTTAGDDTVRKYRATWLSTISPSKRRRVRTYPLLYILYYLRGLFKLVETGRLRRPSLSSPRDWGGVIVAVPPLRWKPPGHVRCAGGGRAYARARPTQQQCWFPPARCPGLPRPPRILGRLELGR